MFCDQDFTIIFSDTNVKIKTLESAFIGIFWSIKDSLATGLELLTLMNRKSLLNIVDVYIK